MDLLKWNLAERVGEEVWGTNSKALAGTNLSLPFYANNHNRSLFLPF